MKDGYPFETKEMDALRAKQRRILRDIPDEVVAPLGVLDTSKEVGRDRLEWLARERAKTILEGSAADASVLKLLGQLQGPQDLADLHRTLYSGLAQQVDPDSRARLTVTLNAVDEDLIEAREGQRELRMPEVVNKLSGLAGLLCWADALADDGYRDPRLPSD